jgi:hypothetical protein
MKAVEPSVFGSGSPGGRAKVSEDPCACTS